MEVVVLKQHCLQVNKHLNPMTFVLEDINEEINDVVK
jgi:hypothetical protein